MIDLCSKPDKYYVGKLITYAVFDGGGSFSMNHFLGSIVNHKFDLNTQKILVYDTILERQKYKLVGSFL